MDDARQIIELQLLATMLERGDFSPITSGDVDESHFLTTEGKTVFDFVRNYRYISDGQARFPSLSIVRSRFSNSAFELPDPKPGDRIDALVFEARMHAARAELIDLAQTLEINAKDNSLDPFAEVPEVLGRLRKLVDTTRSSNKMSLADSMADVLIDYDCGAILAEGIPYPWEGYTVATRGLHAKEFNVFAGRPKSRKTFVSLVTCMHALTLGARILVVTPEMPPRQIMLRCVAILAKLHYKEFKDGSLAHAEFLRLLEVAEKFGRVEGDTDHSYKLRMQSVFPDLKNEAVPSLDIVQGTNRSVGWVESQIEVYRPDIVMVDSFYRLSAEGSSKSDADWKVITQISRSLKDLAMNTNTCVIGTHQMNRGAEGKAGGLGNMALADAVGQDADNIIRVFTGKMGGEDYSALINLGGREVPHDGVLIRNRPCYDFSQEGIITNKEDVVGKLSGEEEEDQAAQKTKAPKKRKTGFQLPKNDSDKTLQPEAAEYTDFEGQHA